VAELTIDEPSNVKAEIELSYIELDNGNRLSFRVRAAPLLSVYVLRLYVRSSPTILTCSSHAIELRNVDEVKLLQLQLERAVS